MSIRYFYINLSHRLDRNRSILKQFTKFDISNYVRINAIKDINGHIGCSKSHVLALKEFMTSNIDIGIFLEDDFEFTVLPETYNGIINQIINTEVKWDVIQLAGNVTRQESYNQFLNRCLESQTSSGYITTQKFAPILLSNVEDGLKMFQKTGLSNQYAIDQNWKTLQQQSNWFITNPKCGKQSNGYSDIEKRWVRYGC